jgi:glutamate---cysteine ligase / carboxylate-amine ligase
MASAPGESGKGEVIEQRFGRALTVGVEEELMILDGSTHAQRPAAELLIPTVAAPRGRVKKELFATVIELNSDVCSTAGEATSVLRSLRAATGAAAAAHRLAIAGAGSHPFDIAAQQQIADDPYYAAFVEYAGPSARRQGVSGLHVHVGMPDAESCLRVLELVLPWLPLLLALSANSPWFEGQKTGMMSTRAEILGLLPRHGAPPAFDTWRDWERVMETFGRAGIVQSYKAIHWDIRPHPGHGTLEIRMPDQPTSVEVTARLAELVWNLCRWALDQPPRQPLPRVVYDQNRWAAARFGPRARLIHPEQDAAATVPDLYAELTERIEGDPGVDPTTCEGDMQLAFADPHAAARDLVERSLA